MARSSGWRSSTFGNFTSVSGGVILPFSCPENASTLPPDNSAAVLMDTGEYVNTVTVTGSDEIVYFERVR